MSWTAIGYMQKPQRKLQRNSPVVGVSLQVAKFFSKLIVICNDIITILLRGEALIIILFRVYVTVVVQVEYLNSDNLAEPE
jgi:hypothetical protein